MAEECRKIEGELMNRQGLYNPAFEHDSCGVGFVAQINGRATYRIVQDGITILKILFTGEL